MLAGALKDLDMHGYSILLPLLSDCWTINTLILHVYYRPVLARAASLLEPSAEAERRKTHKNWIDTRA
jgi:hypothetical protein